MKDKTWNQTEMIVVIVAFVLTLVACILFFTVFKRDVVSPEAPPSVVTSPAALPDVQPVMSMSLPSGGSQSGFGGGGPGMMGGRGGGAPMGIGRGPIGAAPGGAPAAAAPAGPATAGRGAGPAGGAAGKAD